jgi:HAD superfamily hydrolase (TIGR01509 family)
MSAMTGPALRAVIFDLDGTLADSLLDFDAIREAIGLRPGLPILEQLAEATPEERARAEEIMRRHEREAIAGATLTDGCADLLAHLTALEIPMGILTRNIREVVETFARTFSFRFQAIYTREDGPHKPAPDGVLTLCQQLGVRPEETLTVGDYKFDVLAGRAAGCRTVLLHAEPLSLAEHAEWGAPDLVVGSLRELLSLFPL